MKITENIIISATKTPLQYSKIGDASIDTILETFKNNNILIDPARSSKSFHVRGGELTSGMPLQTPRSSIPATRRKRSRTLPVQLQQQHLTF